MHKKLENKRITDLQITVSGTCGPRHKDWFCVIHPMFHTQFIKIWVGIDPIVFYRALTKNEKKPTDIDGVDRFRFVHRWVWIYYVCKAMQFDALII